MNSKGLSILRAFLALSRPSSGIAKMRKQRSNETSLDLHCVQRTKLFYALLYDRFDLGEIRDIANSADGVDAC
jgi:hypothetical protein